MNKFFSILVVFIAFSNISLATQTHSLYPSQLLDFVLNHDKPISTMELEIDGSKNLDREDTTKFISLVRHLVKEVRIKNQYDFTALYPTEVENFCDVPFENKRKMFFDPIKQFCMRKLPGSDKEIHGFVTSLISASIIFIALHTSEYFGPESTLAMWKGLASIGTYIAADFIMLWQETNIERYIEKNILNPENSFLLKKNFLKLWNKLGIENFIRNKALNPKLSFFLTNNFAIAYWFTVHLIYNAWIVSGDAWHIFLHMTGVAAINVAVNSVNMPTSFLTAKIINLKNGVFSELGQILNREMHSYVNPLVANGLDMTAGRMLFTGEYIRFASIVSFLLITRFVVIEPIGTEVGKLDTPELLRHTSHSGLRNFSRKLIRAVYKNSYRNLIKKLDKMGAKIRVVSQD